MLWFALFCPSLPLVAALGGDGAHTALHDTAVVVSDGPDTRPHLRACNDAARALGVSEGMSVGQARALAHALTVIPRQGATEDARLQALAICAMQFTPMVSIVPERERHCVVLEVSASLALFGGVRALCAQLRETLQDAAQRARFGEVFLGLAPTPLAAELFARHRASVAPAGGRSVACLPHQDVAQAVAKIPLTLAPWLAAHMQALHTLGLRSMGDVLALPREGFAKRFGAPTLLALDRAVARAPDPRVPFAPSAHFSTQLDCVMPVAEGPNLLCGVTQTLSTLADWLRARASGTRAFTLTLIHSRERRSVYPITLSEPSCDATRWRVLLIEHFQRQAVEEAVHAIMLTCTRCEPLHDRTQALFADTDRANEADAPSLAALIDRLHARLGSSAVYGLRVGADHRPEQASVMNKNSVEPVQKYLRRNSSRVSANAQGETHSLHALRPTFLLPRPRALVLREGAPSYHGVLQVLSAPERIQTGWWDDAPVARDYFLARNAQGTWCWIFRALNEPGQWYLHGFFA